MRLYTKEDDIYINIPSNMINNIDEDNILLKEYIRIYKNVEKLKEYIIKYLFEKDSSITQKNIGDLLLNIKSEENLDKFINYIDVDIHSLEEKFKNLNIHLGVNINEINLAKEEIKNEYVNNSYNEDFIVNKEYIDEIINCIKDENMYSLRQKSRYGSLNIEGKLKYLEDIEDFNEDEKGGMYSPILVIYRPAKYLRGSYILEDTYYVYIKRQPLNALINQEKLNEKGIDGMGSIIYKKLKHDLTNENLQEILAEIYIYANKNNLNWSNLSKAESGCSSLETLYIRFSIPAETSHSIASSKSLALAPSLTAPYMNFSFDFASCVTILRKTIRIRPLFTLPLCLEKSFSYTSISSR